eukprot:Lithocolla_globosa_v1_NODE_516_length_3842_cov_8.723792.p4 type:complete len:112 gc:universal NODE_516_length_3842_cov_8.723792:600-935(+)
MVTTLLRVLPALPKSAPKASAPMVIIPWKMDLAQVAQVTLNQSHQFLRVNYVTVQNAFRGHVRKDSILLAGLHVFLARIMKVQASKNAHCVPLVHVPQEPVNQDITQGDQA